MKTTRTINTFQSILIVGAICFSALSSSDLWAQNIPVASVSDQLEDIRSEEDTETEDDSYLQQLEQFRRDPLNLNTADASALKELMILNEFQVQNLIQYRQLLGNFVSIYELQAVPGWDIATIQKLLPFISVKIPLSLRNDMPIRFRKGQHSLLFRFGQVLEKSVGFKNAISGKAYLGGPEKIFFRYRYVYKNQLSYGITADKDAGERIFTGKQRMGFDFYSFHFFMRQLRMIKTLAIGDFTVNMGQGLIQWQGLAFKKSAEAMGVKRQSQVLKAYNSGAEFNFQRGIGISIQKRNWESTLFFSMRKLSASVNVDSTGSASSFSSFQTSGNHRTENENATRNNLSQIVAGFNLATVIRRFHIGLNAIIYKFSLPMLKRDEPYNLYSIQGDSWMNGSIDYGWTYRNMHLFGEFAIDMKMNKALLNGVMVSADNKVDIAVIHRIIHPGYQSLNTNAFTEAAAPSNESGLYVGVTIRPTTKWKIGAYADLFKYSWLRYLVNSASSGKDFVFQCTFTASRSTEFYFRIQNATKEKNQKDESSKIDIPLGLMKSNIRFQMSHKFGKQFSVKHRIEILAISDSVQNICRGFLMWDDIMYHPMGKPFSAGVRLQFFETDNYDSRVYAYENDVLYSYSIPLFSGKGMRYYINVNYDLTRKLTCWFRFAQTIYEGQNTIGSGNDELTGRKKSDIKLQFRYIF